MSIVDERPTAEAGEPEEPTNRPDPSYRLREWLSRPYVRHLLILFVILTIAAIPGAWLVLHFMNLSGAPASAVMYEIERTMFVFTLASAPVMAITASILLYSLFGWGRVRGEEPPMQESPAIRSNPIAIFGWITATSLLAAFLVIWGLVELARITEFSNGTTSANQQPNTAKPLDINVTGQQWLWTFEYPAQQKITSDVLVVPIGTPIYFNVTSKDVIHNFWVVELGVKIDANPGAITNTGVTPNKLGDFNIRCAELCGLHHAYMETQIRVVTQEQFDAWVREMGGKRTV
ncbi:MAG: cytochrome c oxidase subunit II [Actinobacteria bacterium]|nr:cytochrome c oxidase subunit II [Actinomycetota bacterium]